MAAVGFTTTIFDLGKGKVCQCLFTPIFRNAEFKKQYNFMLIWQV